MLYELYYITHTTVPEALTLRALTLRFLRNFRIVTATNTTKL